MAAQTAILTAAPEHPGPQDPAATLPVGTPKSLSGQAYPSCTKLGLENVKSVVLLLRRSNRTWSLLDLPAAGLGSVQMSWPPCRGSTQVKHTSCGPGVRAPAPGASLHAAVCLHQHIGPSCAALATRSVAQDAQLLSRMSRMHAWWMLWASLAARVHEVHGPACRCMRALATRLREPEEVVLRAKVLEGELRANRGAGTKEALRRGKCVRLRLERLLGLKARHAGAGHARRIVERALCLGGKRGNPHTGFRGSRASTPTPAPQACRGRYCPRCIA